MNSNDFTPPRSNNLVQAATEMHTDHEIQMAREACYRSASNAIELHRMLRHVSEQEGLDAWASEKISLANDYLRTVKEWLEYELMTKLENRVAENQFEVFESTYNKIVVSEDATDLNIGDPVEIIGNVRFKGATGEIVDFGRNKAFVVVDLYNHGRRSFHSSDVSFNYYADSDDDEERAAMTEGVAESFSDSRLVNLPGGDRNRPLPSSRPWSDEEKKKHRELDDARIRAEREKRKQQEKKQGEAEGKSTYGDGKEMYVGIEAYGVRGMKSTPWRKKFKNQAAFEKWLDSTEGDVEVYGTREINLNDFPVKNPS
jgi:hypothetical protein